MKLDGSGWTGADGEGVEYDVPVKRSKFLRWLLLGLLIFFVVRIVGLVSGRWEFLTEETYAATPIFAVFVFMLGIVQGWASPFRYRIWLSGKNNRNLPDGITPDEFESSVYAHANVSASRYCTVGMFLLFGWLGYATAEGYPLPTDGRAWVGIGVLSAAVYLLLPTIISEFRVPFPKSNDEE